MKKIALLMVFSAMIGLVNNGIRTLLQPPTVSAALSCGAIGNHTAVMFPQGDFSEAQYTLGIVNGAGDVAGAISAVNSGTGIIIRLGAGKTAENLSSAEYISILTQIAGGTPRKFVATAGRNEPNCAEWREDRGFDFEVQFTQEVVNGIRAAGLDSQITLITGQIDHYCGVVSDKTPAEYVAALSATGVQGVALPFYITDGTPDAASTVQYFNDFAAGIGMDIYVTESGPLKQNSFEEFARAVPMLLESPAASKIKTMLLFNAFGFNSDGGFTYTKPFWNPACRVAFRTQCTSPEEVIKICGQPYKNDSFYLYQIDGLDPTKGAPQDRAIGIFTDLVDQGYQAQCTTPVFTATGKKTLAKAMNIPIPSVLFDITSTNTYDYQNAQIPLWRNTSSASQDLTSSIENYFAYQVKPSDAEDVASRDVESSSIYPSLSTADQCRYQTKILQSIDSLCQQLKDPSSCALYQPLPQYPTYSTKDILSVFNGSGLTCEKVGLGDVTEAQQPIAKAMSNVPLFLDRAYRLAFLVVSAEIRPDNRPTSFFNFFNPLKPIGLPTQHEVRVIAFKIPDVATNKKRDAAYYDDPIQITRDLINTSGQNELRIKQQEEAKAEFRNKPPEGIRVNCQDPGCDDPLTKALVDIINRTEDTGVSRQCKVESEDLEAETSAQIMDSASLNFTTSSSTTTPTSSPAPAISNDPSLAVTFKENLNIIKNLISNPTEQKEQPQVGTFKFLSLLDPSITDSGTPSDFSAYLVYPVGYDLENIEESIAGYVFNSDQLETYENDPRLKDYFKIANANQTFASDSKSLSFPIPGCVPTPNPTTGLTDPNECLNTVTVTIEGEGSDNQPRILGGRLGYLMRAVQESAHLVDSGIWRFVRSCQSTEQFLQGRCSTAQDAGSATPGASDSTGPYTGDSAACSPVTNPASPCSVENLKPYFNGDENKALIASTICRRESGGTNYYASGAPVVNDGCTRGTSLDYSVGLFQINALAHCPGAFSSYGRNPIACEIESWPILSECVERWLTPEGSIQKMLELSSVNGVPGENWRPWSAAGACNIGNN